MSDVINAHDLGVAGGYIIEAAMQGDIDQLKAENAKLRELVQSFHSAMLCTLDTGMWPTDPKWLEQRMRELGIEVDG